MSLECPKQLEEAPKAPVLRELRKERDRAHTHLTLPIEVTCVSVLENDSKKKKRKNIWTEEETIGLVRKPKLRITEETMRYLDYRPNCWVQVAEMDGACQSTE